MCLPSTSRAFFADPVETAVTRALLAALKPLGIGYEGGGDRFYALDLPPEADMAAVCARLEEGRARGVLDYETCEAWRVGSFDLPGRSGRAFRR